MKDAPQARSEAAYIAAVAVRDLAALNPWGRIAAHGKRMKFNTFAKRFARAMNKISTRFFLRILAKWAGGSRLIKRGAG